jgi:hypothetical protein
MRKSERMTLAESNTRRLLDEAERGASESLRDAIGVIVGKYLHAVFLAEDAEGFNGRLQEHAYLWEEAVNALAAGFGLIWREE